MSSMRFAFVILVLLVSAFGLSWSRSGSYMGANSGAPGDGDCTGCHSGTVNAGPGSTGITAPAVYQPGDTVDLSIAVAHTGLARWGFEMTALDASDQPAGQFVISDAVNTQAQTAGGTGREYVFQTSAGTYDGVADVSPGWGVKWVAPAVGTGSVTFWLAGIACNGGGTSGDFTYTASRSVAEAIATDVGDDAGGHLPGTFTLDQNYPNPFNPATTISFTLSEADHVRLEVVSVAGHTVATILDRQLPAGSHTAIWDGARAASGVYLYRLQTREHAQTRKMILLK